MGEPGQRKRIIIAASGTGGHLLPALEIGRALTVHANIAVEFIGTDRPLERKLIGAAGYPRHIIHTSGIIGTGVRGVLQACLVWPRGFAQVWRILSESQTAAVVGVGGYASVLPVLVGALRGLPTWIHEAEARPGWANRFLGLFATRISGAYPETKVGWRSVLCTGQPVRREVVDVPPVNLGKSQPTNLLILGGSQGARAVDDAVMANMKFLAECKLKIRHQCRPENEEQLRGAYSSRGISAWVGSYIDDMREAYGWSHIIVGRAGAGAVLEIGIINRPAIFIPLASSQGGHQRENAMRLVTHGKALLVEEGPDCVENLRAAIGSLVERRTYDEMLERPYPERRTDAAERIAAGVIKLIL